MLIALALLPTASAGTLFLTGPSMFMTGADATYSLTGEEGDAYLSVLATFEVAMITTARDSDRDGIHDLCDACPSTPTVVGAFRDPTGCP